MFVGDFFSDYTLENSDYEKVFQCPPKNQAAMSGFYFLVEMKPSGFASYGAAVLHALRLSRKALHGAKRRFIYHIPSPPDDEALSLRANMKQLHFVPL